MARGVWSLITVLAAGSAAVVSELERAQSFLRASGDLQYSRVSLGNKVGCAFALRICKAPLRVLNNE